MKEIKARLIERIKRTDTVESFRFILEQKALFLPGQFLRVILDEDNRENKLMNKYLSMSSSPDKDYIEVTKRISSSEFSKALLDLRPNEEILVEIPMGNCVFRDEYKKIGFLIGGIGITPVISIIEYIVEKKTDTDAYLFYSNRTDEDIAFKKELDHWQGINKNIKVFYTVTDCQPKDKTCTFGFIDKELLTGKASDLTERILFIFGPPKMVDTMCNISLELDCKKQNIKTERFIGY
ncbi:MAG: FAD-dependent oxidoreductase [Candidatus Omnitrophica bacterium]|nr:FAD-dependent oxidoreductase [Candidatus Omnitrophota bacterium]MDD5237919.1 FAD-dependent oxidoreductase [Candidatus Omnitrophota bacterium]